MNRQSQVVTTGAGSPPVVSENTPNVGNSSQGNRTQISGTQRDLAQGNSAEGSLTQGVPQSALQNAQTDNQNVALQNPSIVSKESTPQGPPSTNQGQSTRQPPWKRLFCRSDSEKEWVSKWLWSRVLVLFFLITIVIIAAIVALCVISEQQNGVVPVTVSQRNTIANYELGISLTWTTLPVFLLTLFGMTFSAIMNACSSRQPYVELWNQAKGATSEQSILLDYQACNLFERLWRAMKLRHPLLFVGFIFVPIVNLFLPSLAAHLFDPVIVAKTLPGIVTQNTTFNSSGITAQTDLAPIFDIVLSTLVYSAVPLLWTTPNYGI
jgi:hypothetical protein